jgi:demethylmenaquinone methyltransferase/2-methoxy-6-polyprenyl-1,4-benzoquinol methylase
MATSFDYARQAMTYDTTRAASPSVLGPLVAALGSPTGGRLLDVGGGTGNYSAALADLGWSPVVVDRSPDMLARAAAKGLATCRADAAALPARDAAAAVVMLVSMIHHVPDWELALAEARRVVAPGGTVALMAFTREHLEVLWLAEYLPATFAHLRSVHQTAAELRAALPGARELPVRYDDLVDGSLAALSRHPYLLLDPARGRQTSCVEWAAEHEPDELATGLAQLEADLAAGRRPEEEVAPTRDHIGDAVVLAWTRPP